MKWLKIFIIITTLTIFWTSCDGIGTSPSSSNPENLEDTSHDDLDDKSDDSSDPIIAQGKVFDGNGDFVAYLTDAYYNGLTVFTQNGYLVQMSWDGSINFFIYVYYTGADGSGTAFMMQMSSLELFGKFAFKENDIIYTYASVSGSGIAQPNASIIDYNSNCMYDTLVNTSGTISAGHSAYELKTATRAELGLPDSIPLPITISWDT